MENEHSVEVPYKTSQGTSALVQKKVQLLGPVMKSYDAFIRLLVVSRFYITLYSYYEWNASKNSER